MGTSDIILICLTSILAIIGIIIGVIAYRTISDYTQSQILPFKSRIYLGSNSSSDVQIEQTAKIDLNLKTGHDNLFLNSADKTSKQSFF